VKGLGKLSANLEKTIISMSKSAGPLLFTFTVLIWLLVIYIYFRGIKAYLREKGKEMTAEEIDKLDDLAFIKSRTDEEEKEFKALKAKRNELKKESVAPFYIGALILLLLAVITLIRMDLVIMWLKHF
jgi:ABC-type multidrug transport system fused ATPase/permease subunit